MNKNAPESVIFDLRLHGMTGGGVFPRMRLDLSLFNPMLTGPCMSLAWHEERGGWSDPKQTSADPKLMISDRPLQLLLV